MNELAVVDKGADWRRFTTLFARSSSPGMSWNLPRTFKWRSAPYEIRAAVKIISVES
jgi:hypothetical protein